MSSGECSDCRCSMDDLIGCQNPGCRTSDPEPHEEEVPDPWNEANSESKGAEPSYADISAAIIRNATLTNSFINEQSNLNQDFTDKLAAIDNLQAEIDECFSKVDHLSVTNADAVAKLRSFAEEKYRQLNTACSKLQEWLARITTSQKELIAKHAKSVNDQIEVQTKQKNVNHNFTAKLVALENRLTKLDDYIVRKLDQQMAIDSSAAKEFHVFAYEKYNQLETACSDHQALLGQIEAVQKELTARSISFSNELVELRHKLATVEDEQMDCACSDLRMTVARSSANQKKLEAENARLLNEQAKLQRKLSQVVHALAEQRLVLSRLGESHENSSISFDSELHPAVDIVKATCFSNQSASENPGVGPQQVPSEHLIKTVVSEMRNRNEKGLLQVYPHYTYYAMAIVAFLINFLCFPVLCYIFQ